MIITFSSSDKETFNETVIIQIYIYAKLIGTLTVWHMLYKWNKVKAYSFVLDQ